jgi:hypothetical protein
MPSPSNIQPARAPKNKTAKQRAKAEANKLAYEARCAALKAGTFKGVVELAAEAKAKSEAERAVETERARRLVTAHMSHAVYGQRLTKWLGNRPGADACRIAHVVIPNWLRTQGIVVVDHVRPTT